MEKINIRADNYTCNCVKFLISPNTAKIMTEYVGLKQQRGEHLNLMKLCNVITSHEAGNPSDRIQQIMTLPAAATRLDTSMTAASNVEELLVASSSFSQHGFSKGRQSRSGSSSRNMDKRGRSPYKQKQNDSWNKSKNSSYQSSSDVQWVKRKSSSSPWRNNDTSAQGRNPSQIRGNTPNRRAFQSPGGCWWWELSRSPGRRAQSGSRQQRGRSMSPRGRRCLRCNDTSHVADRCPTFSYYTGSPCEICGLLHKTSAHKNHSDRSGSARRNPAHRVSQNHQTELRVTQTNEDNE